jgi:hypothetical protein
MRKFFALFLIVVLVAPMIVATISMLSVDSWILDRDFYVQALSDERLYEGLLNEELPNRLNQQVLQEMDNLPSSALSAALRTVVTPDYLRTQAVSMTNELFDFFEGRAPAPQLSLDLQPIKQQIAGEAGPRFARALAENLPVCETSQEPVAPGGNVNRCRPSDMTVDEAAAQIEDALPLLLETSENRIVLGDPMNLERTSWFFGLSLRNQLNQVIGALLLVSLLAWVIVGLIAGNTMRERLIWWGIGLLIPALPCALVGLALNSAVAGGAIHVGVQGAAWEGVAYSQPFKDAIIELITPILSATGSTLLGLGLVLTFVGVLFIIIGSRMERAPQATGPFVTVPVDEKPKREEG